MKIFKFSFLFSLLLGTLMLLNCSGGWKKAKERITTVGRRSDKANVKINSIFPGSYDISKDNYIYFSYSSKNGVAIVKMDLNGENIKQITSGKYIDTDPIVSNKGDRILFKRGNIFGKQQLFLINSDGTNCHRIFENKNVYLSETLWSVDDKKIYFIGGTTYNDVSFTSSFQKYCQDIFSINMVDGNLKRLTFNCVTGWITNLFISYDDKFLFYTIPKEDWSEYSFVKKLKDELGVKRKPFIYGNYKLSLDSLFQKRIDYKVNKSTIINGWVPVFGDNITQSFDKRVVLFEDYRGIYKVDIAENMIYPFVNSINTISYSHLPDSLRIYNIKLLKNGKKLIGGVREDSRYQLVLFDIITKKIEKRFEIDTKKIIPYRDNSDEKLSGDKQ